MTRLPTMLMTTTMLLLAGTALLPEAAAVPCLSIDCIERDTDEAAGARGTCLKFYDVYDSSPSYLVGCLKP